MSKLSAKKLADRVRDDELRGLNFDWRMQSRDKQRPPDGDWTTWLLMGGRGSGKTRAGAEWVRQLVEAGSPRSRWSARPCSRPWQ